MAPKFRNLPPELWTSDPSRVVVPGGTQHPRDKNGVEARDWKNVDGTTVYRVSRPLPNPQEAAVAAKAG